MLYPSKEMSLKILLDAKFESINFIELVLKMCEGNLRLRIISRAKIIAENYRID
jgi:hypothetical protein